MKVCNGLGLSFKNKTNKQANKQKTRQNKNTGQIPMKVGKKN